MKILNKLWVNDIGIITVDRGDKVKTYIGRGVGADEKTDTEWVIDWGYPIPPEILQRIIDLHNAKAAKNNGGPK